MKPLVLVTAIAALLVSCSKPSQESASADSTAVVSDTTATAENADHGTPTTLTSDEITRAAAEIFLFVRRDVPVYQTAYIEDITVSGDKFKYTLIKYNGDNAGMHDNSYSGTEYIPTQEEIEAWEKDSLNTPNPYGESYTKHNYEFIPAIDTFYVEGKYVAYLESAPEVMPRKVTLEIIAEATHKNAATVDEKTQEVRFFINKWDIANCEYCTNSAPFISIDFSEELTYKREELYLKAKVMDLTENDVAGLSKEDLSFVRNDIFARHGHTFKTPKLIQRYAKVDWYLEVTEDASRVLNKFEKRNVDFLKKREG